MAINQLQRQDTEARQDRMLRENGKDWAPKCCFLEDRSNLSPQIYRWKSGCNFETQSWGTAGVPKASGILVANTMIWGEGCMLVEYLETPESALKAARFWQDSSQWKIIPS